MTLDDFGFIDDIKPLHCKVCRRIIHKWHVTILLRTKIKYGVCKNWSHGVTIYRP